MAILRMLWAAVFGATFLYGVVLAVVPAFGEPDPILLLALGAVAVSSFGASLALPRVLYTRAIAGATWDVEEVPAPDAITVRGQPSKTLRRFARPEQAFERALALFRTPYILGIALAESVALFGFVLGLLGARPLEIAPFFAAAWVLFLVHLPREAAVRGPLERATGARFGSPS